jgi:hypothetical protein
MGSKSMMTENSFTKVCEWLQAQIRKQNSIHIVFALNTIPLQHEAWRVDSVTGNETIKLTRSNGHGEPYTYKTVTKEDFQSLDQFLASTQISLSKESIRKSFRGIE